MSILKLDEEMVEKCIGRDGLVCLLKKGLVVKDL